VNEGAMERTIEKSIGLRIRKLRESKGMTLAQLSKITGFSKGLLSRIENGHVSSPVSTLLVIADSLKVRLAFLLDDFRAKPQPKYVLTRAEERTRIGRGTEEFGLYYDMIAHEKSNKKMIPAIITLDNKDDYPVVLTHVGDEFLYVLEGRMNFKLGDENFIMEAGDSIYFEADVPHQGTNIEDYPLKVLMVICQGEQNDF
jgi:transcriptional regulator with XRE-family HTH domain